MAKTAVINIRMEPENKKTKIPRYNEETLAAFKEVEEMKKNPKMSRRFKTVEELFEDLDSDD